MVKSDCARHRSSILLRPQFLRKLKWVEMVLKYATRGGCS